MIENNNALMTKEEIQNALGQTVMSIGLLQQDLKTIYEATKNLREDVDGLKEDNEEHYQEFVDLKTYVKDTAYISNVEYNSIQRSKKMRVADLLEEVDRFDLFGKFCAQLLREARDNANYLGHYTMKKDYNNLLEWIGTWVPSRGGVRGYIEHLDRKNAQ